MGSLIIKENMFPEILSIYPKLTPYWHEFHEEWAEVDEKPLYLILSKLADLIVGDFKSGQKSTLKCLFSLIEKFVLDGDQYVREAAIVGLLEEIQTKSQRNNVDISSMFPLMGEHTKSKWVALQKFWDGNPHALFD